MIITGLLTLLGVLIGASIRWVTDGVTEAELRLIQSPRIANMATPTTAELGDG